jgi:transcriptional regulator GlxA family with amidase domain
MDIAILLFDGITALDAVGPYEVLSRIPNANVRFVAPEPGPKRTDNGFLALNADHTLTEFPHPEIVLVPGGWGHQAMMDHAAVLNWLRGAHQSSRWTSSVCTGSLVLGAAGLLRGLRATTHWTWMDDLGRLGATPVTERVVIDGKVITAAGVSAGIDMALRLAAIEAGEKFAQAIQLGIEYDPQPPFDCGSPAKAPPEAIELVRSGGLRRRKVVQHPGSHERHTP